MAEETVIDNEYYFCLVDFRGNDNFDNIMRRAFESFSLMMDTPDFVPDKVLKKLSKLIYKNLRRDVRKGRRAFKQLIRREKRAVRLAKIKSLFNKKKIE